MKQPLIALMLAFSVIGHAAAVEPETEMTAEQKRIAGAVLGVTGAAIIGVAQGSKEDAGCSGFVDASRGISTRRCTEDNHDKVQTATIAGGILAVGGLVLFAMNSPEVAQFRSDEYGTGIAFSVGERESLFFGGTEKQYATMQYRLEF